LGIIGSDIALPALGKLLQSDETAGIACLALSTYPPGKADELLRTTLVGAEGQRRIQIVNTLGDRRDAKSVKLFDQLARQNDATVTEASLAALGKVGNSAAAKVLASLRPNVGPAQGPALTEAMLQCAQGLASRGERSGATVLYQELLSASEPAYVRRGALGGILALDKDHGERRIMDVLHGSDTALKPVAIAAIRTLPSKGTTERFALLLPALRPEEQVWMLESLAARGDAAARDAAGDSLESPSKEVRRAAAFALGRLGDESSVPLLGRALAQSDDPVESRAIEMALKGLRGGEATDRAMTDELKKASGQARAHLITALAAREGRAANELLLHEIRRPEPVVVKAAFRALGTTATAGELAAMLQGLDQTRDSEVRSEAESAAAQTLARVEPARRSVAVRDELVRAHSAESRCSFVGLLPGCGGPAALAVLRVAAGDDDASVRLAAVRALADWPDASAWDSLVGIYHQPETEAMRSLALRGLVRLADEANSHPDAKLVDGYRELLNAARSETDLRLILGTLGGAAHPDALQLAVSLLDNPAVRSEAEVAVKKIAESIKGEYPQAAQEALSRLER
jgi:HEAT repeat protein